MKKSILIASLLTFACVANAGIVGALMTSDWAEKPTKRYKLDVYGYDARAYEFTTDNGMKCVMVFPGGSATGFQMQCLPSSK